MLHLNLRLVTPEPSSATAGRRNSPKNGHFQDHTGMHILSLMVFKHSLETFFPPMLSGDLKCLCLIQLKISHSLSNTVWSKEIWPAHAEVTEVHLSWFAVVMHFQNNCTSHLVLSSLADLMDQEIHFSGFTSTGCIQDSTCLIISRSSICCLNLWGLI